MKRGTEGALDRSVPSGTRTAAEVGTTYRVIDKAVLFLPPASVEPEALKRIEKHRIDAVHLQACCGDARLPLRLWTSARTQLVTGTCPSVAVAATVRQRTLTSHIRTTDALAD